MWSSGSHKVGRERDNFPPFKDLNIFDTLEPEKVETFGTNNVKTGILVDINDSDDHTDPNLLGSLLDVKKNEYSLVDLFENLYVTPQHVSSKNSDLELLLDNTEHNVCTSDSTDIDKKNETPNVFKESSAEKKVRSFDEILDSAVSSRYPKLDYLKTKIISEDNVDSGKETLTLDGSNQTPRIGVYDNAFAIKSDDHLYTGVNETHKNALSNLTIVPNTISTKVATPIVNTNSDVFEPIKVLKPPSAHTDVHKENINLLYEAPRSKEIGSNHFNISHIFNNISLQSLKENENEQSKAVNPFQPDTFTRYRKMIQSSLVDLNKAPMALIKNTQPVPVLQTVKKDNKLFNKRRVVKKDCDKIGFTKGPDIYEKSVVLPQIVQRLGERKKALDAQKNFRRKLVLDKRELNANVSNFGAKTDIPKLTPEVLMEDCNKERLKALKLRTDFERFVISGQI